MKYATLLFLLALSVAGCREPGRCVEASAPVDDPSTPLAGGTYGDVLALLVGERVGTASWLESEAHVRGFPEAGQTGISVVVHEPTMASAVSLEKEGGLRNERLACPGFLELELELEVRTDDGALDTSVLVPMVFRAVDGATAQVDITDLDLGMLEFDPVDEGAALLMTLSYDENQPPTGSLRLDHRPGSGSVMSIDLVTWVLEE